LDGRTNERTGMRKDWQQEHELLAAAGFVVAAGLTEAELLAAESAIGSRMPPDLRQFLSEGLPIGSGFPNWREPRSEEILAQLEGPFEGIAFDIEHNAFWWASWGPRPLALADAIELARRQFAAVPRLIPIYGHRYIPAEPCISGNPVYSVYQTDVIYYGMNLSNYLRCEFAPSATEEATEEEPRTIRFWDELVA